jgi:N-methylhydantoinase B
MDRRELSEPILLELLKHAVDAIVDEMAIALVRTAYSNNLKNSMDMSCALCDARGRLIAQGMTLPLHLGSIPDAMGCITRKFATSVRPDDVFILSEMSAYDPARRRLPSRPRRSGRLGRPGRTRSGTCGSRCRRG